MRGHTERLAVTDAIKLVLFDMDNVLCNYDRGRRVSYLAALAGHTPAVVHQAIWDSGFEQLGDCGALDAEGYLRGFGERLGYPLSLDEWIEARRRAMQADHVMIGIAGMLSARIDVAASADEETVKRQAFAMPELEPQLAGKQVVKSFYVPGRLLNIVVK